MDNFFEVIRSFIIKAVVAGVIYLAFGVVSLAISGDDAQLSPAASLTALVVIVVLANIIGEKISRRKKG